MNTLHHYDPDNPYPDSDGLPIAENTQQYEWLVKIKENLEILFAERDDVFIAGDLFWYPIPDRQQTYPVAPDVMVVIGRPKGKRGSYRQWEENNIAPQVVFEILSPSNSSAEMAQKKIFYEQYGVQEYYVYNPERNHLEIWIRQGDHLRKVSHIRGWVSSLLGIRFKLERQTLRIFYPSGQQFLSSVELHKYTKTVEQQVEEERLRADAAEEYAESEWQRAEAAEQCAEKERQEKEKALQLAASAHEYAEQLKRKLQALGIDLNS